MQHWAGRGVSEIKVYDRIPRAAYFALVDEAARQGLAVVGHRPHAVSAAEAAAGQKSIDHARVFLHEAFPGSAALRDSAVAGTWREDRPRMLAEHDSAMAEEIFAAFAAHGTWYVPTHLTRWADAYADAPAVRDDSLLHYLHPLMRWQWMEDVDATVAQDPSPEAREAYRAFYRKGLALTGAAHRAGVQVLVGSDYVVAGADVHRELAHLVEAGLSPAEALRAATLHPARYYALEGDYGSVAVGKVADLLLLEANPLEDIAHTPAHPGRRLRRQPVRPRRARRAAGPRAAPRAELVGGLQDPRALPAQPGQLLTWRLASTSAMMLARYGRDPVTWQGRILVT